jgi:nitroreductase
LRIRRDGPDRGHALGEVAAASYLRAPARPCEGLHQLIARGPTNRSRSRSRSKGWKKDASYGLKLGAGGASAALCHISIDALMSSSD